MKEKIKIFLKKLKNILPLLVSCLIVGIFILSLYVFSQSKQVNTLSASAEEASTVADVESGIDLTQYPSANLFYFNEYNETLNGVTYSVVNNVLTVKGTATSTVSIWLLLLQPLSAGTYSFASEKTPFVCFLYFNGTSERVEIYNDRSSNYTRTIGGTATWLQIVISADRVVDLSFGLMCNAGETVYPFIPPLDMIYYDGYNAGYGAGETDGYDQGKTDGLDLARAGYWNDCMVSVNLQGTNDGNKVGTTLFIKPLVISNGVDLKMVYHEISARYPNLILTSCSFALRFNSYVFFDNLKIRCIGDFSSFVEDGFYVEMCNPVRNEYGSLEARFSVIEGSNKVIGLNILAVDTEELLYGKQLMNMGQFSIQDISQFNNLRFYSADTMASTNYTAGYQAGLNDDNAYQVGYDKGFELGEKKGFDDGVIKGQSNDPYDLGDFLFSIIDAPFRVIREALSFEFLGYDVSKLVLFVITALLVVFVVKKVKGG